GQRPIIFYSNGYEHFIWDDTRYPPRPIQGFYKKSELELIIQRRISRKEPATTPVKSEIVERYYQTRAIRRISEAFSRDRDRKALVVMATGAGKTRTVIALCELLMRCNWVKRVLFLADRVALVKQAVNAFKTFLPDASPVNLVTEKDGEGRVFVSTYPTMMGLIDETRDEQRRFGVGHFDLVIIDEAHRSVYEKYRAIFEYFDSLLVGLTATPKEDINRDTYRLFDLEKGVPTDAYPLAEAVKDKFLVPARSVSVPLKFQREGIAYDDLSDEEKEKWDLIEWGDEEERRERVEAAEVNKWLFNADTVDKVLELLMTRGQKVAGGDRLGKTIIFAKNHLHAEYIAERFNAHYPKYCGEFARVIDFQVEYAQSLIDAFSQADKPPHIAISVDMLDTGIDVPEVVNLVFFKLVRSKTKFWQMVGRGTRLCPNLFGPGQHKLFFSIFDFCQNLEYFSENPETTDGAAGEPLSKRLFKSRVELIGELDDRILTQGGVPVTEVTELPASFDEPKTDWQVRQSTVLVLQREIASMNLDNFVVRPKRRFVEKFSNPANWMVLSPEARQELAAEVAGLPSGIAPEEEEAKRFDLLMLSLQLANLRAEPAFERLREQVKTIAGLLEEKKVIPLIQAQLPLILDLQTDEWWQDITTPLLEKARRRLRSLVKLIEKGKRVIVYTDFEDESSEGTEIALPEFAGSQGLERFRAKARAFLTTHL
ncbi:MAG TPA: DEAD/DEAH box helicase family protein, partial [Candidatus Ozemobacteraceae bacterium]|nr:DEAD/DEAH box helicase family protein [Candidatus Ozemobacteraceae bacterium]